MRSFKSGLLLITRGMFTGFHPRCGWRQGSSRLLEGGGEKEPVNTRQGRRRKWDYWWPEYRDANMEGHGWDELMATWTRTCCLLPWNRTNLVPKFILSLLASALISHPSLYFFLLAAAAAVLLLLLPDNLSWVSMAIRWWSAEKKRRGWADLEDWDVLYYTYSSRDVISVFMCVCLHTLLDSCYFVSFLSKHTHKHTHTRKLRRQSFDWLVRDSPWQLCQRAQWELNTLWWIHTHTLHTQNASVWSSGHLGHQSSQSALWSWQLRSWRCQRRSSVSSDRLHLIKGVRCRPSSGVIAYCNQRTTPHPKPNKGSQEHN